MKDHFLLSLFFNSELIIRSLKSFHLPCSVFTLFSYRHPGLKRPCSMEVRKELILRLFSLSYPVLTVFIFFKITGITHQYTHPFLFMSPFIVSYLPIFVIFLFCVWKPYNRKTDRDWVRKSEQEDSVNEFFELFLKRRVRDDTERNQWSGGQHHRSVYIFHLQLKRELSSPFQIQMCFLEFINTSSRHLLARHSHSNHFFTSP